MTHHDVQLLGKRVKLYINWEFETMDFDEWKGIASIHLRWDHPDRQEMIAKLQSYIPLLRPWINGVVKMDLQEYIDKMGYRDA